MMGIPHRGVRVGALVVLVAATMLIASCGGGAATELPELDSAEAYFELGQEFDKEQEYYDAINAYSKTIELDPDFALAYRNRGFSYYRLRKGEDAIKDYERFIELDPDSPVRQSLEDAIIEIRRGDY